MESTVLIALYAITHIALSQSYLQFKDEKTEAREAE